MTTAMPHFVFLHQRFPCSGAEQVTIDVANHLCRRGFSVTVLTADHRPSDYHAGQERLFSVKMLPGGRTKWSPRVARVVRTFVLQQQVGVLVTYRELLYARWLKRQTGVRLVYELHNTPGYEYIGSHSSGHLSRWFYKQKYRRVYRWADAYGVLCEGYRQMLIGQLALNPADNKLWVLPNSISPAAKVVLQKEKLVIYVGRLTHRDKRVDRLLRIWQQVQAALPDWQLKIIGSGKGAPQLKALAGELQLERCTFEGHSTHVADYYDRAAVLCLTSSFEGWPMVVAEAQAHGVVPILFDSFAAAHDLVATPDEGILVQPFDEMAFAQELVALCTDDARLGRMRQAVVRKAATYSIDSSGAAWETMLRHILGHGFTRLNTQEPTEPCRTVAKKEPLETWKTVAEDNKRHILVYRLSALGDVAMTLPAVYSVARAYPQHRFHVVMSAFCAQLYVDAPENITVHGMEAGTGTIGLLHYLSALPIDSVADLHNVLRSWVIDMFFLLRGKRVAMLLKHRGERRAILRHRQTACRPFVQRYFDVFARLGLPCEPSFTSLFASLPPLPLEVVKGAERWIGIAPFARYINKVYPIELMRQVAETLAAQSRTRLFLFGSKGAEAEELKQWEQLSPQIISVAGRLSLQEELALMAHLDVMVTMDSANMHLASLVGTRVVSLWGSTTPACGFLGWGQHMEDALCLDLPCQPCTIGGSKRCKRGNLECLRGLSPSTITNEITKNLEP